MLISFTGVQYNCADSTFISARTKPEQSIIFFKTCAFNPLTMSEDFGKTSSDGLSNDDSDSSDTADSSSSNDSETNNDLRSYDMKDSDDDRDDNE
jgi:hypothetical protein